MCNLIRFHIATYKRPDKIGGEGRMVYLDETFLKYVLPEAGLVKENAIIFGMASDAKVISGIVDDRKRATLIPIIERYIQPGSVLVTDGCSSYSSLKSRGWDHITVDHSKAFHNFHGVTTNPIEVYWSCLKRSLRGCYRQVKMDNLWKYLAEVEFRYNRRGSCSSLFDELINAFPTITDTVRNRVRERYDWRENQASRTKLDLRLMV